MCDMVVSIECTGYDDDVMLLYSPTPSVQERDEDGQTAMRTDGLMYTGMCRYTYRQMEGENRLALRQTANKTDRYIQYRYTDRWR